MSFPVEEWLRAFPLTLGVELPIAAFLLRRELPGMTKHGRGLVNRSVR